MFWNKKINSEEYEKILKQLTEMQMKFASIDARINFLETSTASLRGFVNRKCGVMQEDKTETNKKPSVLLRPDGDTI